jgi:hypothetical protein
LEVIGWGTRPNKLWDHASKAHPSTAKLSTDCIALNRMKQTAHPFYSPDLTPLNFLLFVRIKRKLMGYHAESLSELLIRIRVILSEIPGETLNAILPAFSGWIEQTLKMKINLARQIRRSDTKGGHPIHGR